MLVGRNRLLVGKGSRGVHGWLVCSKGRRRPWGLRTGDRTVLSTFWIKGRFRGASRPADSASRIRPAIPRTIHDSIHLNRTSGLIYRVDYNIGRFQQFARSFDQTRTAHVRKAGNSEPIDAKLD